MGKFQVKPIKPIKKKKEDEDGGTKEEDGRRKEEDGGTKEEDEDEEGDLELNHIWEWYYLSERDRLASMHVKFIQMYSPKDEVDGILAKLQELNLST